MKRIISLLLAVLMLAVMFCGCGGGETDAPSSSAPSSTPEASEPETSEPEDTEPEVVVPTEHFTDLETFDGAAALLGKYYEHVPFWKLNIAGTVASEKKDSDPFATWRTFTMTFEGTAPKLLGIDAPAASIVATDRDDKVNSIQITFVGLSDDDKATLKASADKCDVASVKEIADKVIVTFEG